MNKENINPKVLIVEDDFNSGLLLETNLRVMGFESIIVKTGEEALFQIEENSDISLIFMDIKLPGIDGIETTKRIKELNNKIKVIAQTAYALIGDRERCLQGGCDEYISKPIDKNRLKLIVERFTQN
jgi:CheY-like chemotaxis protein